jgi:cation diffusion facilitator family transporter
MAVKFAAYYITASNAVLTDALESIINVFASGFAFYSIYLSAQPKDQNHPYGHGKIEFFSAGFEGALIILAGVFILWRAITQYFEPVILEALPEAILLVSITIVANLFLGYRLITKGKQYNSVVLVADGRHLLVDALSSFVLTIGMIVIKYTGFQTLDSILSMLLAAIILYNGYKLMRKSVAGLMDEADQETMLRIVQILRDHRRFQWIDVHNLRIQKYGSDLHIDCHVTLPYYLNVQEMHDEVKAFEDLIQRNFITKVEIFVHVDPCMPECCHYCAMPACPVRQHAHTQEVVWNSENLYKNQKHTHELSNITRQST